VLLAGSAAANNAQPILVSELGIVTDAPFQIGVETGLFADAHLDVQTHRPAVGTTETRQAPAVT
jgi:ABC-type nitrate/sulfonate/bicarbonate transport system substrate-binding protein